MTILSASRLNMLNWLFALAWMFIIFISVIDGYLVWHFRAVIGELEQNPAGIALMTITGGSVWLFLSAKSFGTIFASTWMMVIYRKNASLGIAIVLPLASFQFGLLLFLHYA